MTEHEQNLRDLAAMFAMNALLIRNKSDNFPHELAYKIADAFMKERAPQEGGIADILNKWGDQA